MIGPGPGRIGQLDGEELDDEEVIIRSAHFAHETIVLQPDVGVSFAIVLDDIVWCSKMLWEMSIMYGASVRIWARPFRNEVASFAIVVASMEWVPCASLGLRIPIPWVAPSTYLRFQPSAWTAQPVVG
jgi:hypothetical protein